MPQNRMHWTTALRGALPPVAMAFALLAALARLSAGAAGVAGAEGAAAGATVADAAPAPSCLRSGPMVGATEMAESRIWLQTRWPCRVQLRFWPAASPERARLTSEVTTAEAADWIARFDLSALELGTAYEYELYLDGRRAPLESARFTTQTLWQWRSDPPPLRAALGSCFYVNEPEVDRPGEPYGGGYEILDAIARQQPDLMLWLGDNVYYREADFGSEAAMRRRYAHTRALPELQPLLRSTAHYAIWDDHDYGANDGDRSFREREAALEIFEDYWANPAAGTRETPGAFFRFTWSDVEFFLLDGRYHRNANDAPAGAGKRMFGREQLAWLADALASSHATFKVIVSGGQMLNGPTKYEGLAEFPTEQRELLDLLRAGRVEGVVLLSGDRHHSELLRRAEPGLYPLYEFTSSPLTAGGSRQGSEGNNPLRVPGTWITDGARSFGLLEVSGPKDDRRMVLRALGPDGRELWRHEIAASALRFPSTRSRR